MKKIFLAFFLFFSNFFVSYGYENIEIILRDEWGANLNFMDRNSSYWQEIIANPDTSENTFNEIKRIEEFNEILKEDKYAYYDRSEKIYNLDDIELAWPIQTSENIRAIVIHHTEDEFYNSLDGVNSIYKYHSIYNEWGDIGYNFIIGYDGEIFEGRAGGEIAIGAHVKRNNIGTIGISIIGDYKDKGISEEQYNSLYNLVSYLSEKYDINPSKKTKYLRNCIDYNCDTYLEEIEDYTIIGHTDAGHTNCPGEKLYTQIQILRGDLINVYQKNKIFEKFNSIGEEKLLLVLKKLDDYVIKYPNKKMAVLKLKKYIKDYLEII